MERGGFGGGGGGMCWTSGRRVLLRAALWPVGLRLVAVAVAVAVGLLVVVSALFPALSTTKHSQTRSPAHEGPI